MDTPDNQAQSSDHTPREVVEQLIQDWNLHPHPEGGWYREMHRSPEQVTRSDGAQRSSITTILFLLDAESKSCWHAVHGADEIWIHLQGSPLSLWTLAPDGSKALRERQGRAAATASRGHLLHPGDPDAHDNRRADARAPRDGRRGA